jgi:glycosyltransferase involved in cell wall biosynthesis
VVAKLQNSRELHPPTNQSKLVTFALFSYNQEDFIKEAVEAAFAQTYEPLEIILSDDCSADNTYAIMEKMATAYKGPHRIIINRNKKNLGLIAHVNNVIRAAAGEIIVMAAGDDISIPKRTESIARRYLNGGEELMTVHSSAVKIDKNGAALGLYIPPLVEQELSASQDPAGYGGVIGATLSLRKSVFTKFGDISISDTYEDLVIAFRSHLCGAMEYIEEPLVFYRFNQGIHAAELSIGSDATFFKILKRKNSLKLRIATCSQRIIDSKTVGAKVVVRQLSIAKVKLQVKLALVNFFEFLGFK